MISQRFIRSCSLLMLTVAAVSQGATYHVGNSLTWDAMYRSLPSVGTTLPDRGYHIRCGMPLPYIWEHPTEVCTSSPAPYGMIAAALGNFDWDAVTLQPHVGSTLATDTTAITSMIDLVRSRPSNATTPIYIYETWPQQPWGKYQAYWTTLVADEDDTVMRQRRDYYTHLYARVDEATDANLRYVPAGEVLYRLSEMVDAGTLPGVTHMSQFYRDDLHLSSLGQYVAGTTMFTALSKVHPSQLWVGTSPAVSVGMDSTEGVINQVIMDVLLADRRSGLCDFNDDGQINNVDLELLKLEDPRADANLDGFVDGTDFLAWQQFADPTAPPLDVEIASVPEPSTWLLALLAVIGFRAWRAAS
jgi:hypothetical protein